MYDNEDNELAETGKVEASDDEAMDDFAPDKAPLRSIPIKIAYGCAYVLLGLLGALILLFSFGFLMGVLFGTGPEGGGPFKDLLVEADRELARAAWGYMIVCFIYGFTRTGKPKQGGDPPQHPPA